jgi:hypothetical protein
VNGRRYLLFFLVVFSIALVLAGMSWTSVRAEAEPTGFKNMRLWIYPEYDDPRLLVMMEGEVEGVDIPATVRFIVPAAAEMYSAGSMDANGNYTGGPPRREPSSIMPGWDEISYEVTAETFRVEYYDPIIIGQPDKTIAFEYHLLYPISDLTVISQEPRTSTNYNILPRAESNFTEDDFFFHLYSYSDLTEDQSLNFDISYTKSNPNPSVEIGPPVADFSALLTSGDAPLDVDFTDQSTGDISSWSWDFGDTNTSNLQNPSHTYTTRGTYTVSLEVTGPDGSDTETKIDYIGVGGVSSNAPMIGGAIVGVLILISVVIYIVVRFRARQRPAPRRASVGTKQRMASKRVSDSAQTRGAKKKRLRNKFCTECGNRLEGSYQFCPNCGTKQE